MSHVDLAVLPDPPRVSTPDAPSSRAKIRYGASHSGRVERYSSTFTAANGQPAQLVYSANTASDGQANAPDLIRAILDALEAEPVWQFMKSRMAALQRKVSREAAEKKRRREEAAPMPAPQPMPKPQPMPAPQRMPEESQRAKYSRQAAANAVARGTDFAFELGELVGHANVKRIGTIRHPARPLANAGLVSELERRQRYARGESERPWYYQTGQHSRAQVDEAVKLATRKRISFDAALAEVA